MRSSTSRAPGMTFSAAPARWTSVPSTSKTKPRLSSRRTPPYHQIVARFHPRIGDRRAELELAQQADKRRAVRTEGCGLGDRAHRVHLLLRHRQAQQQLLVRDAGAEAP